MKRIISLLVALAMVIAMIPSVFAGNNEIDFDELQEKVVVLDSVEEFEVTLAEGEASKAYRWTPEKVGTLSVYYFFWEMPEGTELTITMTQGDKSVTYVDGEDFALEVEPGVEVYISFTKTSEAALKMPFYGDFVEPEGTEGNPILLYELENTVNVEGATWYQTFMDGTTMTITGKAPFTVVVNGEETTSVDNSVSMAVTANRRMNTPFVFCIEEQGEYQINFEYPLGSDMNPAELVMGENTAVIEAGSQGYFYSWTAEEGGKLTITMPQGDWTYQIYNLTTGVAEDIQWSDSDPVMSTYEVNVFADNEIQIVVNTYDPQNVNDVPAGTLTFTAAFEVAPNSETNPIIIQPEWNDEWTSASATVTAPVGTTYYGAFGFGGMMLSINGGEPVLLERNDRLPATFAITNDGTEEAEYTLVFTFAPGSSMNPAQLVIGENAATVAEGSWEGYLFTWTAETDGKLTITMPEGDWFYVVNNMTTGIYGDFQYSDADPVQASTTVDVKAGDEIQVNVNTYDPNGGPSPAGTLVITAAFEEVTYIPGDLDGNEVVDIDDAVYLALHTMMSDVYKVDQPVDFDSNGKVDIDDAIYLVLHTMMPGSYPLR